MSSFFNTTLLVDFQLPLLAFLAGNLLVAYTAYRLLIGFFYSDRLSERCSTFFLLMIAEIILVEQVVGVLGILTFATVISGFVVVGLLVHWVTRSAKPSGYQGSFAGEMGNYLAAVRRLAASSLSARVITFLIIFFSASLFFLNLCTPTFYGDVLNYHFPIPAAIIQTHSLFSYQQMIPLEHFFYPINGQLLALWTMLPFRSDFLARTFQTPFPFLIMLTFYALARKLNLSAPRAYLFSFLTVVFPWILQKSLLNRGADEIFTYSLMLVAYYLVIYQAKPKLANTLLLAVSFGFFLGSKYLAVSFLPGLVIIWIYFYLKRPPQSSIERRVSLFPDLLIVALGGLILGGFVYLRNWVMNGSPIFPSSLPFIGPPAVRPDYAAQLPQFAYQMKSWIAGKTPPYFALLVMAVSLLLAVMVLWRRRRQPDQSPVPSALAWGVILMLIVYAIYPFMNHSRYVLGILFLAVVAGLAVFESHGILAKKGFLPLYLAGCCLLLMFTFLQPTEDFYGFYTRTMLVPSFLLGAALTLAVIVLQTSSFTAAWGRLHPRKRWLSALVLLFILLLPASARFNSYPPLCQAYHASHFHPLYAWIEKNTTSGGKNILTLDMENFHFLFYGAQLQNKLYRLSPFAREGWDEAGFLQYLQQHQIDWIFCRELPIRNRKDLAAIQKAYRDKRDLSGLESYKPVFFDWMQKNPERFKLVQHEQQADIYQYLPLAEGATPPMGQSK